MVRRYTRNVRVQRRRHRPRIRQRQSNQTEEKTDERWYKMGFKHAGFNQTEKHEEKGVLTGKKDALFLRNKYQTELDNSHSAAINMIHYIEDKSSEMKSQCNYTLGLKKDKEAHEEERSKLYDSLGNLLTKETDFEDKMWKTTQKGRKVKSITVKQKFKDSDIDEMRYDSMMNYLKQYPEYASKSSFRKITEKIEDKEREIRQSKQKYNDAVSKYNFLLSELPKDIKKAEDKVKVYHEVYEEGENKLKDTRYRKSVFYKMASEETKSKVRLDTLRHRIEQFSNTLDLLKEGVAKASKQSFVEMEY
jgi:hypothetical protein